MRHYLFLVLLAASTSLSWSDVRDEVGTRSMPCALAVKKAIQLSGHKQHAEALREILTAIKADPQCELAQYWYSLILGDMGEVDKSMEVAQKLVESARRGSELGDVSDTSVDAAINMGLAYGKLGKHVISSYWLSQAILLDLQDFHKFQWKAYRNMAINSYQSGDALSATLQALKARELAPTRVEEKMIQDFANAIREDAICMNILYFNKEPVNTQHPVRPHPAQISRDTTLEALLEQGFPVAAISSVPGKPLSYIFYKDQLTGDIIDTAAGQVKKITLQFPVGAVAAMPNGLFASRASKPILDHLSLFGKAIRSYTLPGPASSVAVCPGTQQAFLAIDSVIYILDLESGKIQATDLIGQVVCLDSARHLVYSTYKPPDRSTSGHMIINGRPVFFNSMGDVFRDQNVIFKGAYKRNGVSAVAAIRTEAASNGYTMDISRDGKWITVTGGGGYRGPGGRQGYGTGVLSADDMAQLEGFYDIDAYSLTAIFNPVTDQLALFATKEMKVFNLGKD